MLADELRAGRRRLLGTLADLRLVAGSVATPEAAALRRVVDRLGAEVDELAAKSIAAADMLARLPEPSPIEIDRRCRELRNRWDRRQKNERAVSPEVQPAPWTLPEIASDGISQD